jgi:hypothetical protein
MVSLAEKKRETVLQHIDGRQRQGVKVGQDPLISSCLALLLPRY